MFARLGAVLALGIALSGCATIIKGTDQSIAITTPPTTGATCTLSSSEGNWQVVTPSVVTVEKSKEDIQARCSKPGWEDGVATIPSNFEGWTAGNLILGGIVGLGVDAADGAINEYPHAFQIPMTPIAGFVAARAVNQSADISGQSTHFGVSGDSVTTASVAADYMRSDPTGVSVYQVDRGSAAEQAGIKAGDVIKTFAGRKVVTTNDLDAFVSQVAPGSTVSVGLNRRGDSISVTVHL